MVHSMLLDAIFNSSPVPLFHFLTYIFMYGVTKMTKSVSALFQRFRGANRGVNKEKTKNANFRCHGNQIPLLKKRLYFTFSLRYSKKNFFQSKAK